ESLGEQPQLAEYQRRFPEHAAVLEAQLELERAMEGQGGEADRWSSGFSRSRLKAELQPTAPQSRPIAVQPARGEEELRALLRPRLRNLGLIAVVFLLTQAVTLLSDSPLGPDSSRFVAALHLVPATVLLGLVVVLWRRPNLSVRPLRWLELGAFAVVAACLAVLTWTFFAERMLTKYAAVGPEATMVLAFYVSARWFALLVIYGLFIPNSWRRCAVVVCALAAAPVVLCAVLAWSEETVAADARFTFV